MTRFLCLYFPQWPIQRLNVLRPEYRSRAVLLFERDPRRGEIVTACSSAAVQQGVRRGMPLAEAKSLSQRTGEVLPHDRQADLAALANLATLCDPFSPWVGWETMSSDSRQPKHLAQRIPPAELLLDISDVRTLLGGEATLAANVAATFQNLGYEVQLGIADTLGGAWGLAHADFAPHEAGIIRVSPPLACLSLPVALLRLTPEIEGRLVQLGLERIEQILPLPQADLPARFGQLLVTRLEQFCGRMPEWVQPYRSPPRFRAERQLEFATPCREVLAEIMEQLLAQLTAVLRQYELGAMQIVCTLVGEQREHQTLEVGLYRPSASVRRIGNVLRLRFEQTPLHRPVEKVCLEITQTAKLESRQGELFADLGHAASAAWEELLERLSGRLGASNVLRASLCGEVLPERAFRLQPLCGLALRESTSVRKPKTKPTPRPLFTATQRPLRLHSPRGIRVQADDAGKLHRVHLSRQRGLEDVQQQWGPERIESGWWRGGLARRDYYRIETTAGDRYWLFRDLRSGRWYWQGTFG